MAPLLQVFPAHIQSVLKALKATKTYQELMGLTATPQWTARKGDSETPSVPEDKGDVGAVGPAGRW